MGRQLWLADVLADEFRGAKGFRVEGYVGWETRGSATFDPVGVMDHHTGPGGYDALLNYMAHTARYAPLCNVATSRPSGGVVRVTVVAAGRANHAGRGHLDWTGTDGGNRRTIGVEHHNDGAQAWPAQQVEAMRRVDAALLRHLGRGVDRLTDHKVYAPRRKVDRHTIDVAAEAEAVAQLLTVAQEVPLMSRAVIPSHVQPVDGRWPFVALSPNRDAVVAYNGLGLAGGRPAFGVNVVDLPDPVKGRETLHLVEAADRKGVVVVDQADGGTFTYAYDPAPPPAAKVTGWPGDRAAARKVAPHLGITA